MQLQLYSFTVYCIHWLPYSTRNSVDSVTLKYHSNYIKTRYLYREQEVKVIWQNAPHGGPISRLGVTPGSRKLYHWIPGVGFPISVP